MLSESRWNRLRAWAWPLFLTLASAWAGSGPVGNAIQKLQGDMAWRQQQQMMFPSTMYWGPETDGNPVLPAYLRIFAADGSVEGMGALYVSGLDADGKPEQSWAELAGKRYFPEATDSMRVWDLTGYPKERNWVFVMARGAIEAYAYYPPDGARFYARTGTGARPRDDASKWKRVDSLSRDWGWARAAEGVNGDATMAIRLVNAGVGDSLTKWTARLGAACKGKRFAEADSLIAKAGGISPDYPWLQFRIGNCEEKRGRPAQAVAAWRKASRFAGLDEDLREDAEANIRKLEAKTGP